MAKAKIVSSAVAPCPRPKPSVEFDLPEGLPSGLPEVKQDVTVVVKGKLLRVQAGRKGDWPQYDSIKIQPESVAVSGHKAKKQG